MTKRLVDLYVIGQELRFEDGDNPDLVVYLKKLQPFEQEVAMNRANVQRAKVLTLKKLDSDHEEVLPFELQIDDNFSEEEIVSFVSAEDVSKAYRSVESRLSNEEEWTKDDYLSGLQESWEELKDHYHSEEYPEQHADAIKVFNELKRFSEQIDVEFEKERNRVLREWGNKPTDELRRTAVEKLIEMKADMKWLNEFKMSQIWLATRDPKDHNKKYFLSREEVNEVHPDILQKLMSTYEDISVSPDEGKD